MYEFKFHRPATVRQAANILTKNEDAKLVAGGHTLIPVMKQRLASPPHLVDLSKVDNLIGIEMKGRSLSIGAMTTAHADSGLRPCQRGLEIEHVLQIGRIVADRPHGGARQQRCEQGREGRTHGAGP